jgi:N-acetylglucosaminyldiphosphoundecaprenol N-acetyl-beta-D-mannosaminyltransferase
MKTKWYEILGVKVNLLSMIQLNELIGEAVKSNSKWIVANHNLNSLYIFHHNSAMKDFYNKVDYIHIDGMALIFLGKLLNLPFKREHRVTYADWVWSLMEQAAADNWRVLYLGSKPGVAERGATVLRDRYPGLKITTAHGYFSSSSQNQLVIDQINSYQPNILMVGMGMPRQEEWILANIDQLKTNIVLPSGACIDYIAQEVATPPRWMGKVGLEWLYRLATEPKRLWRRYLVEPWFIAKLLIEEFLFNLRNKLFSS